jgi:hypothetical protein
MPLVVTLGSAAVTLAIAGLFALRSEDDGARTARVEPPPSVQPAPAPAPPPPPPPAPPLPPEPTPQAAAALPPQKPEVVKVEIRATPPNATLWIDDAELASNPFGGNYRKDNDVHHVRASAPGHVTKIVALTFDANTKLDLSLERIEPTAPVASSPRSSSQVRAASPQPVIETPRASDPAPAPSSPPPSAARAASPAEVDPAGGKKPVRTIDPINPYGGAAGRPIDPSNPYAGAP